MMRPLPHRQERVAVECGQFTQTGRDRFRGRLDDDRTALPTERAVGICGGCQQSWPGPHRGFENGDPRNCDTFAGSI